VALSGDNKLLAGDTNGALMLWDVEKQAFVSGLLRTSGEVRAAAIHPDGRLLAASAGGDTRLWWPPPTPPVPVLPHDGVAWAVAFSPDRKTVATGGEDKRVHLWDAGTGTPRGELGPFKEFVRALAFNKDGRVLLVGRDKGTGMDKAEATLWDVDTGHQSKVILQHNSAIEGVAFSPDGDTVVVGGRDGLVQLWDVRNGRPGRKLQDSGEGQLECVGFSPDGQKVVAGCAEKARVWDVVSGAPLCSVAHLKGVTAGAFSPDGRTLATASYDRTAWLWDAATGQPIGPPLELDATVWALAFTPDGTTLVTACVSSVRLWDVVTLQPLGPSLRHGNSVHGLAVSPDGKTILTGSLDTRGRLWPVPGEMRGEPELITLWAEATTGLELDDAGHLRPLEAAAWRQRCQRLADLGGPPP
jgi:WD40 repeat protein